MTYKELFDQANFKIVHDTDFCAVISDNISHYLLYRYSTELSCYSLSLFQDFSKFDVKFLYDIKDNDENEEEEYVFENLISKEKVLSYIFSLIELDSEDKILRNPFKNAVSGINKSNDLAIVLNSVEKRPKPLNLLHFSKDGYKPVYSNTNCLWKSGGEEQNKTVIAWNPYSLHSYFIESGNNYSAYILVSGCDNFTLRSPLLCKYEEYNIICSSLNDCVEALRFVIMAISCSSETILNLQYNSTMMELEIIDPSEDDTAYWINMSADVVKKIRLMYYGTHQRNFEFIKKQKQIIQKRNYLYLSIIKSQPVIKLLCNYLCEKYQLKINIIHAL
jgi:hypothetical protein